MMTPWDAGRLAPDPLRVTLLLACTYSAVDLRERIAGDCAHCGPDLCTDHAEADALATQFENAYMQVAAGTREWCDLAVKLISEMN